MYRRVPSVAADKIPFVASWSALQSIDARCRRVKVGARQKGRWKYHCLRQHTVVISEPVGPSPADSPGWLLLVAVGVHG